MIDNVSLKRDSNGKPYAEDLPGSFNLSHSGNFTALYINPFSPDAGCDLQLASGKYSEEEIAELCFQPEERSFSDNFFLLWTLKEALLKARGLSVFDMKDISVISEISHFRSWEMDTGPALYYLSVYPVSGPVSICCPYPLRQVL